MKRLSFLLPGLACYHLTFSQPAGHSTGGKEKPATLQPAKAEWYGFSPERLKRIDNHISEWVADSRLNGAVALIIRNGKIIYHKALGYDDLEKTKLLRTDHIFRITSQTKAITSVAVMMLYEERKFLLEDPVSRYIPEFAK